MKDVRRKIVKLLVYRNLCLIFLPNSDRSLSCSRASNFGQNPIAKAKRKRIFFRIKKRSEAKANTEFFSAKRSEANSLRFAIFRNPAKIAKNFFQSKFLKIRKIFLEFMSLFMSRSSDQLLQYFPAWRSTKILFF